MNRKIFAGLASVVVAAGGVTMLTQQAMAAPNYCMREGYYYADRKTGGDRADPAWDYYAMAWFDYNNCNGPNACNDTTIQCLPPE